jgi:hypothetical protein
MRTPVNMPPPVVTPTVESVRAACARARQFIEGHHLCLDATIDDYPIGRRERGECRHRVERARGKGYRTFRTMTDKFGRCCKPSKSTLRNDVTVVPVDLLGSCPHRQADGDDPPDEVTVIRSERSTVLRTVALSKIVNLEAANTSMISPSSRRRRSPPELFVHKRRSNCV